MKQLHKPIDLEPGFAMAHVLLGKVERIAAARERLAAEGRPWGRPRGLTEAQRAIVLALKSEGRSIREIAVAMKVPHATVARALKVEEAAA